MNYPGQQDGEGGRPSHLIDPRKKDNQWILDMAKSIYQDFNRNSPDAFFNARNRYDNIIRYIQGTQSVSKYQSKNDNNKEVDKNLTAVNHSNRPVNLVSKYFRIINNKLSDVKLQVTATPQSPNAVKELDEYKSKLEAGMEIKKILDNAGAVGMDDSITKQYGIAAIPTDTEDLEIEMQMSSPMLLSKDLEKAIMHVNYLDKLDDKYEEADYFLAAFGATGMHEKVSEDGLPYSEKADPRDLLVGFSKTNDYRDIAEIGEFRKVTLSDIKEEIVGKGFTEDEYKQIANDYVGKYGNDNSFNSTSSGFGHNDNDLYAKTRVLVLDLYFYSYDDEVKLFKKNKSGNQRVHKKDVNYYKGKEQEFKKRHPYKELKRTRIQNVYKCSWIVDSDFTYNTGLHRPLYRTGQQPNKTKLPIQLIAPLLQDGRTSSITEELIKWEDYVNQMFEKMEESVAHSRPPGFEFDVDSLNAAVQGLEGQWQDFDYVMNMMVSHNIIPTSSADVNGMANGRKPFTELAGGLGKEFFGYIQGIQFGMQMMESVTGFGAVASGGDVKYTGKRTAELAVDTANDAIKHLIKAKGKLFQNHMQLRSNLLFDSLMSGKLDDLTTSFGSRSTSIIKKNKTMYDFDIKVEFKATDLEWQSFYALLNEAKALPIGQGGISVDQRAKIHEVETLKEARGLLYMFVKRNAAKAEQQQSAMAEQKAQLDQQSAAMAAQQRQELADFELAIKAQMMDMETKQKMLISEDKHNKDLLLEKFKALVNNDQQLTQGDIDKMLTELKVKGNMDRLKGNTQQIGTKK